MSQVKPGNLLPPPQTHLANRGHTNVAQIQGVDGFQFHAFLKPSAFGIDSPYLRESPAPQYCQGHGTAPSQHQLPPYRQDQGFFTWLSPSQEGKGKKKTTQRQPVQHCLCASKLLPGLWPVTAAVKPLDLSPYQYDPALGLTWSLPSNLLASPAQSSKDWSP